MAKQSQDPGYKPVRLEPRSENQRNFIRSIRENEITFCSGPAGAGKAQPLDSKVLTPTGYTQMGLITVGDQVMTPSGKPAVVNGVFPQGSRQIYGVSFSDGSYTECCLEHLWKVRINGGPWKILQLSEMLEYKGSKDFEVPLTEPLQFDYQPTPLNPYALGLLLGDGGFSNVAIRFTNSDKNLVDKLVELLPTGHKAMVCNDGISYRLTKGDTKNWVQDTLVQLGLHGLRSHEKFIPDEYLYNDIPTRLGVLQGLLDTDGSFSKHCLEYSTSSEIMSSQVVYLVQSLGGKATLSSRIPFYTYKGEKRQGKVSWRVRIVLPSGMQPFLHSSKKGKYVPNSKYHPKRFIRHIKPVGVAQCQCIMVDHPDHLYITDDMTVTHNTHCSVGMAVQMFRHELVERIIITRPLVGVGRDMGYLPGNIMDKVGPYVVPCFDELSYYLSHSMIGEWHQKRVIEVVPLSMMRGRTFNDCFVILDEAQNATREELKLLLTRMGVGSRLVISGDENQSDLPRHDSGGLMEAISRLNEIEGIGHVQMQASDIVRSPLIAKIIEKLW